MKFWQCFSFSVEEVWGEEDQIIVCWVEEKWKNVGHREGVVEGEFFLTAVAVVVVLVSKQVPHTAEDHYLLRIVRYHIVRMAALHRPNYALCSHTVRCILRKAVDYRQRYDCRRLLCLWNCLTLVYSIATFNITCDAPHHQTLKMHHVRTPTQHRHSSWCGVIHHYISTAVSGNVGMHSDQLFSKGSD